MPHKSILLSNIPATVNIKFYGFRIISKYYSPINLQRRENTYIYHKARFSNRFLAQLCQKHVCWIFLENIEIVPICVRSNCFHARPGSFFAASRLINVTLVSRAKSVKKGAARDRNIRNAFAAGILLSWKMSSALITAICVHNQFVRTGLAGAR